MKKQKPDGHSETTEIPSGLSGYLIVLSSQSASEEENREAVSASENKQANDDD